MRAVCLSLGTSLPTDGPGLSAFIRFIFDPDALFIGMIANRNTRTPIPPIQCVKHLQNIIPWDIVSTSLRILAPVVVSPDTVSKSAFVNDGISPDITNGIQPNILSSTQLNAVAMHPSFRYIV